MKIRSLLENARQRLPSEGTVFERFGEMVKSKTVQGRFLLLSEKGKHPLRPLEGTYTFVEEQVAGSAGEEILYSIVHEPLSGEPVRGVIIGDGLKIEKIVGFREAKTASAKKRAAEELLEGLRQCSDREFRTFRNGKERR